MGEEILRVENLKKYFKTRRGLLHAVDGITFSIEKGKTLGLVGESGCGKSTTGRLILRLLEPTGGKVFFEGREITGLNDRDMLKLRRYMQIIFQDPFASLNPRKTVYELIGEPLRWFRVYKSKADEQKRIESLMETVGLAQRLINAYPHELDGGRRQRIGVARALALEPKLIVCDEPVSALDVSIQAQILNLLDELQEELGLTYLFITHDLSVVNHFSDDIAVMYLGKLVEKAPAFELFQNPLHPYTQALLSAIPIPDVDVKRERVLLKGEISSPINPRDECRFAKRCHYVCEACRNGQPPLREVSPGHFLACVLDDCLASGSRSGRLRTDAVQAL
jgi:peptide/nickel transport system ATP-binding protein